MHNTRQTNIAGLDIPTHDFVGLTYVGATNNIDVATYRQGGASGTVVATLTFTYVGGAPAVDDARIATITRT